jgi:phosphatidate cytidylyltransferase
LFELYDALVQSGRRIVVPFGLLSALVLLLISYFERPELFGVAVVITAAGAFLLSLRPNRGRTAMSDAAWLVLGVVWIGGGGAGAVAILVLESGVALMIAFLLTTAADDITAYFVGVQWGRRKLAPSLSPAKSWEGAAGGLAGALIVGAAFGAAIDVLGPLNGLVMGAIIGIVAPVGDLVESMAKREIGIKDSGRWLPGHGGFLDRLDAIIFSAPIVYLFLRLITS